MFSTILIILAALNAGIMKLIVEPAIVRIVTRLLDSMHVRIMALELAVEKLKTEMSIRVEEGDRQHQAIWEEIAKLRGNNGHVRR